MNIKASIFSGWKVNEVTGVLPRVLGILSELYHLFRAYDVLDTVLRALYLILLRMIVGDRFWYYYTSFTVEETCQRESTPWHEWELRPGPKSVQFTSIFLNTLLHCSRGNHVLQRGFCLLRTLSSPRGSLETGFACPIGVPSAGYLSLESPFINRYYFGSSVFVLMNWNIYQSIE